MSLVETETDVRVAEHACHQTCVDLVGVAAASAAAQSARVRIVDHGRTVARKHDQARKVAGEGQGAQRAFGHRDARFPTRRGRQPRCGVGPARRGSKAKPVVHQLADVDRPAGFDEGKRRDRGQLEPAPCASGAFVDGLIMVTRVH